MTDIPIRIVRSGVKVVGIITQKNLELVNHLIFAGKYVLDNPRKGIIDDSTFYNNYCIPTRGWIEGFYDVPGTVFFIKRFNDQFVIDYDILMQHMSLNSMSIFGFAPKVFDFLFVENYDRIKFNDYLSKQINGLSYYLNNTEAFLENFEEYT